MHIMHKNRYSSSFFFSAEEAGIAKKVTVGVEKKIIITQIWTGKNENNIAHKYIRIQSVVFYDWRRLMNDCLNLKIFIMWSGDIEQRVFDIHLINELKQQKDDISSNVCFVVLVLLLLSSSFLLLFKSNYSRNN